MAFSEYRNFKDWKNLTFKVNFLSQKWSESRFIFIQKYILLLDHIFCNWNLFTTLTFKKKSKMMHNFWRLDTMISLIYDDFWSKTYLTLYPSLGNLTTYMTITSMRQLKWVCIVTCHICLSVRNPLPFASYKSCHCHLLSRRHRLLVQL